MVILDEDSWWKRCKNHSDSALEEKQNAWLPAACSWMCRRDHQTYPKLAYLPVLRGSSKAPSLAFPFGSQGVTALQKLVFTLVVIDYLAI